ncbi:MAG: DUF2796 domain-containing protein [Pseudomonadota bacterium]
MHRPALLIACLAAIPAFAAADETRQLDAHVHGTGTLNMAIEGRAVQIEFHAPGADLVGFEYAPESDADVAAVEAAKATLSAPLALFALPAAAGCSVVSAAVELEVEGEDDHGDDHAHGHDHDHGHDHAEEATHSEFHAEYALTCTDISAATTLMTEGYFATFPNAEEIEVQIVGPAGAQGFEATAEAPDLAIGGLL